jgi:hypothetical protein
MANPDNAYQDYQDDNLGWIPAVFVIILFVIFFYLMGTRNLNRSQDNNRCRTYYQGDELIEECN